MQQNRNTQLQEAIKELKSSPTVNIKGKAYTQVSTRINIFRKYFPNATVETFMTHNDDYRVIMQAKISIDGIVIATGYAEELRGEVNSINSTSMVEVCETSAVGRVLANFGLGGSEYSSSFEVENAIAHQNNTVILNKQQSQHQTKTQVNQQSFSPHEFSSLFSLGLQVVEKGSELIVIGDRDIIFNSRDSIKSNSFRWSSQNKYWYRPIDQQQVA